MAFREIEPVEVVVRGLDLATVDDRVSEAEEDVFHLAPDLGNEVQLASRDRRPGHRDVDPLLGEAPVELGALQLRLTTVDGSLEALAKRVQRLPGLAVADVAERELERALATEVLDPHLLDLLGRRRRLERGERVRLERLRIHGGDCSGPSLDLSGHRSSSRVLVWDGKPRGGTREERREARGAPPPRLRAGAR